ncbi:MAG TPA: helicase-related protein [Ignavibacteriaceae bacterium]|nr:DEAD/DEAH box helicase [Ignavibacterium sp.]HRN26488.1 helicase-related protein [Ignavibacteriaceae bacterium]HRP92742.1 helicase-related protein [Ignavibacteriaceae bacterium]HRQ55099.1 helicase-related protein [Ignavibacteriaceae bacterium]
MIRTARTKIASKVSKLEATDDFHFAKWLRVPKIEKGDVTELYSLDEVENIPVEKLIAPNGLKLKFRLPVYKIPDIRQSYLIDKPKAYLIFFGLTRPQLYMMKEKVLSSPEIINLQSSLPQIPEIIDQSSIFIAQPPAIHDQAERFIAKVPKLSDRSSLFFVEPTQSYDQSVSFYDVSVTELPLLIKQPIVTDELANLVPEIYNIELLNEEKFDDALVVSEKIDIDEFNLPSTNKIDVPGIDDIINSVTESFTVPIEEMLQADVKFYSPSFEIAHPVFKVKIDIPKTVVKKVVITQKNLDPIVVDVLNDSIISEFTKNNILSLLSSFRELGWAEYSKMINPLTDYQLESAEFLSSNNFAVLNDELGYEKFDQTSAALGYLSKKNNVKSVLLISDAARFKSYWTPSLKSFTKDLKIKKVEPGTTKKIKGSSVIWFLDINDLGKIELKDFSKLDLILFDELVNIKSTANQIDQIVNKIEPSYIWILSAINNAKASKKFLSEFEFAQKVSFNTFGKTLSDIQGDEPETIIKDIWLELDEMQLFEYSEALEQSKVELNSLFDSPNPLRFQSNIFTIIHKLKQILNFSAFRNISPKANLLIEQVEAIAKNKSKAIIFTQYDVNGLKKIEKTLELNNIKFAVGRNGMSAEELKQSLSGFYDRRDVTVLLTNLKPSRVDINLNKVQYIFNFDQWWNPITQWQNDDEIGLNEIVHSPVVVYNYQIKNTFEEALNKLMEERGLDNRYLFANLKSEGLSELITMEDWLFIFGMNDQFIKVLNSERTKLIKQLQSIDLTGYKTLMKYFFSYLGYRDLSVMDIDDDPMFYIIGSCRKGTTPVNLHGKCLLTTDVKKEDYEEVIHFKQASNEIKRKFIITNGEFSERIKNGTMYIDGKDLANFVITLGLKSYVIKSK